MAGRSGGLYEGTPAPNVDPKVPDADASWRCREGRHELGGAQAQLLRDDRRVGLDVDREVLDAHDATGTGRGWDALGDDRLERGHRPRESQLILQTKSTSGVRDQIADAPHRAAARRITGHAGLAV